MYTLGIKLKWDVGESTLGPAKQYVGQLEMTGPSTLPPHHCQLGLSDEQVITVLNPE